MKSRLKKIICCTFILATISLNAQDDSADVNVEGNFELGSGLQFSFNEGAYQFKLGGMIQPYIAFDQVGDADADYFMNARRSYFNISGRAVKEKVSFFLQTDFSLSDPLLDAWIAVHPTENFNITFGQKQTIANNREMQVMETFLQFPDRSLLSSSLSNTGREFGLYIDYTVRFGNMALVPQIAATSGDGRNSFGADSRDEDLGGLKYAGRLDFYPLGEFTKGNENLVADLMHEESVKLVLGAAASFNDGASNAVGEGHGEFLLYNQEGDQQLPDYRQLYGDVLLKYNGFSVLGEYAIATATNLKGTYTDLTGRNLLAATDISESLVLGSALNVQLGYVTKSGYAADVSYSATAPEFDDNVNSQLRDMNAVRIGLSKYFKGNDLKLQTAVSSITDNSGLEAMTTLRGELLLQLIF
ncbi:OprO/OprP family phosphate-selective porin [Vicingaceae bacterium]|nr:OprO/OprP family phosphate-selective porin [Vicingaceae bacterium]